MAPSHDENENYSHTEEEEDVGNGPGFWTSVWENNKGALMILISELFGSSMDAMARFLQQGGRAFPVLQIIVFRMGITFILSSLYMWYIRVPHLPFGPPEVRGWLVLRALSGFTGLFSLYYSVHYLPLAEATVFRFLIPLTTAWACHVLLGQPFTRKQLIAGLVAIVGVVIIAHPESLFGKVDDTIEADMSKTAVAPGKDDLDKVTPSQRAFAITVALFGVFGATGAYTCIRHIGARTHTLMSVNYFAFLATTGSTAVLLIFPEATGGGFVMPRAAREWLLLITMGIFGFVLQFLLTKGLQLDKSPKATSMLYSQVVFALMFDWLIWGVLPGGWSLVGGAIVIASTLWSALQKNQVVVDKGKGRETRKTVVPDEETALLGAQTSGVETARR